MKELYKLLEEDEKEKAAAAAGSQKKSKEKKAGGQGTASACNTVARVRDGMQIWVKTQTVKTITGQDADGQDHHTRVGVRGGVK